MAYKKNEEEVTKNENDRCETGESEVDPGKDL
jgi:hypothetical protein